MTAKKIEDFNASVEKIEAILRRETEKSISNGEDKCSIYIKGHNITYQFNGGEIEKALIVTTDELVGAKKMSQWLENNVGDMVHSVIAEFIERMFRTHICVGYSYEATNCKIYKITMDTYDRDEYVDTDLDDDGKPVDWYATMTYRRYYAEAEDGQKTKIEDTGEIYGIKHGRGNKTIYDLMLHGERDDSYYGIAGTQCGENLFDIAGLNPENIVMNKTE